MMKNTFVNIIKMAGEMSREINDGCDVRHHLIVL